MKFGHLIQYGVKYFSWKIMQIMRQGNWFQISFCFLKKLYKQVLRPYPANIYLFKASNRNTRKRCEICSKLTLKTPERRYWLLLLTLNIFHTFFLVFFFVNFEQVNFSWVVSTYFGSSRLRHTIKTLA